MSKIYSFFILISLLFLAFACKNKCNIKPIGSSNHLEKKLSVQLPFELKEISGIAYAQDIDQWVVVNDEKGYLYFLNQQFELVDSKKFGPRGDYEGIEVVDSFVYVINSKGNIFRYNYRSDIKSKPWKTALRAKNDIEGLGYDNKNNNLIIACKGSPHLSKKKKSVDWKAVYAYSLDNYSLTKKPFLKLSKKKILEFYLKKKKEDPVYTSRINRFSPSGISHYSDKDLFYTLSAYGNFIVVSNREADIEDLIFLDKSHHQAEGIYISDRGNLVISDEAKKIYGKITSYDF